METNDRKTTIKLAVVELSTLEDLRALLGGEAVNAKIVELPAEELREPARILPFRRSKRPPFKAA